VVLLFHRLNAEIEWMHLARWRGTEMMRLSISVTAEACLSPRSAALQNGSGEFRQDREGQNKMPGGIRTPRFGARWRLKRQNSSREEIRQLDK